MQPRWMSVLIALASALLTTGCTWVKLHPEGDGMLESPSGTRLQIVSIEARLTEYPAFIVELHNPGTKPVGLDWLALRSWVLAARHTDAGSFSYVVEADHLLMRTMENGPTHIIGPGSIQSIEMYTSPEYKLTERSKWKPGAVLTIDRGLRNYEFSDATGDWSLDVRRGQHLSGTIRLVIE